MRTHLLLLHLVGLLVDLLHGSDVVAHDYTPLHHHHTAIPGAECRSREKILTMQRRENSEM
jgi:hypothetical protein